MSRMLAFLSLLVAALALAAAAAATPQPGPPKTEHATWCDRGNGFQPVTMWLTAGMAAGDTFWLDDGSHYLIQRYRHVTTSSAAVPSESSWSPWGTIGLKTGRSDGAIECRGYFLDDGAYYWVDSIDLRLPS